MTRQLFILCAAWLFGLSIFLSQTSSAQDPFKSTDDNKNPVRIWKDSTGKYEIKAKLLSRTIEGVKLEKEDGRVIEVPLTKLCAEDKTYLESLKKKPANENPFAGGEMKKPAKGNAKAADSKAAPATLANSPVNTSGVKAISLTAAKTWNVKPDANQSKAVDGRKPFDRPASGLAHAVHDRMHGFVLSENSQVAAVGIGNAFGGEKTILHVMDLVKSQLSSTMTVPYKDATVVGVTNDGTIAVTKRKEWFKIKGRVDFWNVADGKAIKGWEAKYNLVKLLNNDLLLTIDAEKNGVVWNWKDSKAIYTFKHDGNPAAIQLSQTGKQLAIGMRNEIHILNVEDFSVLGTLSDSQNCSRVAFSQDGTKLSAACGNMLSIYDLTNGKLIDQYVLNGVSIFNANMEWIDNDNILINGKTVVNYKLRVPVWSFEGWTAMPMTLTGGGQVWYAVGNSDRSARLVPGKIPFAAINDIVSKYVPEDFLVIKPGMKIAIKLNLPFGQNEQQKIYDSLAAKLKENGITVDATSNLVLQCYTERGKQQTREYNMRGRFGGFNRGTEKVTFTPTISYMKLMENGKELWNRVISAGPGHMIMLKEGQTTQQVATELSKAKPQHFLNASIPKQYAKIPDDQKHLGSSKLTGTGIQ